MSSIFGLYHRDGSPVDKAALEAMGAAHAAWQPDAKGIWCEAGLGLGHCLLGNTPESQSEQQPLVSTVAGDVCVITADLRLDNRTELESALGLEAAQCGQSNDVELLMLAWQKWGDDCPRHLLGDFAFVVWDGANQRLFCCRDHMGIRPFYYFMTDDLFAFASDIRVLLALKALPRDLSPYAVAIYLNEGELESLFQTFLKSVHKLPASMHMTVSGCEDARGSYWQPEDAPSLSFDSSEACAAALRGLLKRAVSDRLRSAFPVYAHLSGGLDSSAIATLAARQLAGQKRQLKAFNWVYPPSETDDDSHHEWSFARRLANDEGIDLQNIDLSVEDILDDLENSDIALGNNVDTWYETKTLGSVKKGGGRTILSGWGGDELISHAGYAVYGELFWTGCFSSAIRGLVTEAKQANKPLRRFAGLVRDEILLPRLPEWLRDLAGNSGSAFPDYLKCAQADFRDYVQGQSLCFYRRPVLNNRAVQLNLFHTGHIQNRIDSWSASAWEQGIEYRYPLLDVRVVEFALGLAATYYRRDGQDRYIFREACKGLLPEDIRLNRSKYEPHRVGRLIELELAALRRLLQSPSANCEGLPGSKRFINVDCVKNLLPPEDQQTDNLAAHYIDLIEIILKSVRILRIGQNL